MFINSRNTGYWPGGYYHPNLGRGVPPGPQNPDPIPDQTFWFFIPYPRLKNQLFNRFQSYLLIIWLNLDCLSAGRKRQPFFSLKRPNRNPIPDQNRTLSQRKWPKMIPYPRPKSPKSIPYRAAHTRIANIGEYPPRDQRPPSVLWNTSSVC